MPAMPVVGAFILERMGLQTANRGGHSAASFVRVRPKQLMGQQTPAKPSLSSALGGEEDHECPRGKT